MDTKTQEALKIVFDYLAISDEPQKADAIFLATGFSLSPKKVIIVDRPEHQRRGWVTFAKQWPGIDFINCPADEELKYDQKMLDLCVAELERLKRYTKKGNILEQKFPKEILLAWKFLKPKVETRF